MNTRFLSNTVSCSAALWIAITPLVLTPLALADNTPVKMLEPVIVTATRTEQKVNETLAPATVITRQQIELQQPEDVYALLQQVPGVVVANSGGLGSNAQIFMRGTNANHTLVLINGQRMGSATLGTTALEFFTVRMRSVVSLTLLRVKAASGHKRRSASAAVVSAPRKRH